MKRRLCLKWWKEYLKKLRKFPNCRLTEDLRKLTELTDVLISSDQLPITITITTYLQIKAILHSKHTIINTKNCQLVTSLTLGALTLKSVIVTLPWRTCFEHEIPLKVCILKLNLKTISKNWDFWKRLIFSNSHFPTISVSTACRSIIAFRPTLAHTLSRLSSRLWHLLCCICSSLKHLVSSPGETSNSTCVLPQFGAILAITLRPTSWTFPNLF